MYKTRMMKKKKKKKKKPTLHKKVGV